ncbi:MAG: hypothetical protein DRP75_03240 [Candidatus Omnitrophota bacterium]|nr:MAG: hypothetical protein DRP75_03240 [Candidatus Omnitrophota bacterium]
MRKKIFKLLIFFYLFFFTSPLFSFSASEKLPFRKGEAISYRIKWKGIYIGRAKLVFNNEIVFTTNTLNFKDTERIKGDGHYYPVEVRRDIRLFGNSIKILEEYDQKEKKLSIFRQTSKGIKKRVITSKDKMHHPILLIYYCRTQELSVGKSWIVNFPLIGKCKLEITRLEEISTPIGKFFAYRIESSPAKIRFWISADKRRLPLKVERIDSFFTRSSFTITGVTEEL